MDSEQTRRAVLSTLLGGGVAAGLADPTGYLSRFAPFSGGFWEAAGSSLPERVESDHGPATLRYDGAGVAHLEGESESATAFAVGYAQGADRLFQMDLQRRVMRGELAQSSAGGRFPPTGFTSRWTSRPPPRRRGPNSRTPTSGPSWRRSATA